MSSPIALSIIALIAILSVAYLFFGKKTKVTVTNDKSLDSEDLVIADEFKEEYERGMNPRNYEDLTFYTLIKCVHCGRLEKFLVENEIPYAKVLLDNFEGKARKNLMAKVISYNERGSFPTLVSPEEEVTVGFREWQVREKFMKYSVKEELSQ